MCPTDTGGATGAARPDRRRERGAVTAETVMVLPVLVALTLGPGLAAVAGGDPGAGRRRRAGGGAGGGPGRGRGGAVDLGRRVAPDGAHQRPRGRRAVVVRVSSEVRGPGGLFRFLPGSTVDAEAVAAKEPG